MVGASDRGVGAGVGVFGEDADGADERWVDEGGAEGCDLD